MRKIIQYECEICKKRYDKKSDAKKCEDEGIPKLYPIGMIFSMYKNSNLYKNSKMVFAIIKQYPQEYGHHHSYSTWACRDGGNGDNAGGEDFCGLDSWENIYPPDKKLLAYRRMIKALKDSEILPIDYKPKK